MHAGHWVYVVDDDPSVRAALARLIGSAGYGVVTFDSARDFLQRSHDRPACVVADLRMPERDGLELRDALQRTSSSMPIILITGVWDDEVDIEHCPPNVLEILTKPVSETALITAIEHALGVDEQSLAPGRV